MTVKRIGDILISLIAIIVILPLFIITFILIYFKLGWPVFFTQERVGKNGRIFKMFKFRTMLNKRDKFGNLFSDEERLTSFGKFLRSTSVDEIPELLNVLKGDMSLVGPRPLLLEYLPKYTKRQMRRHEVLPGITGWAQVNGRNAISWNKKFELDLWYVENWSIGLDLKILYITLCKVIKRAGINQTGQVTVEKFNGFN